MRENSSQPNFIGIGAQKCATTWLSECLRSHPQVFMSSPKELHFWGHKNFDNGIEWYLRYFQGSDKFDAVGEFSPSYLAIDSAARQIYDHLGPIKIIVSLRDPVIRFVSHYKQYIRKGSISLNLVTDDLFTEITRKYPALLNNGRYGLSLKRYIDVFGSENVMVLFQEFIDSNPQKEIQKLYRFLGVSDRFIPPEVSRKISVGIVPKYEFLEKIRISFFYLFQAYAPHLIDLVRKSGLADQYRRLNEKKEEAVLLTDTVQEKLREYYRADISVLRSVLKVDDKDFFPPWASEV